MKNGLTIEVQITMVYLSITNLLYRLIYHGTPCTINRPDYKAVITNIQPFGIGNMDESRKQLCSTPSLPLHSMRFFDCTMIDGWNYTLGVPDILLTTDLSKLKCKITKMSYCAVHKTHSPAPRRQTSFSLPISVSPSKNTFKKHKVPPPLLRLNSDPKILPSSEESRQLEAFSVVLEEPTENGACKIEYGVVEHSPYKDPNNMQGSAISLFSYPDLWYKIIYLALWVQDRYTN
jgi:hypothetical protein